MPCVQLGEQALLALHAAYWTGWSLFWPGGAWWLRLHEGCCCYEQAMMLSTMLALPAQQLNNLTRCKEAAGAHNLMRFLMPVVSVIILWPGAFIIHGPLASSLSQ